MAGVVDLDTPRVVIKREIEDTPESPEHTGAEESTPSQADTNGQKQSKVPWGEEETRSMLELHKNLAPKFKDGKYSKKQLLEDVVRELNLIGYITTPEKVRNKMKSLKARYKGVMQYNAKHVEKKLIPFQEELTELYNMECFDDMLPLINGHGSSPNSSSKGNRRIKRRPVKSIPASHTTLKSAVVKKKNSMVSKATKVLKKKVKEKPLYQCGLCFSKFQACANLHEHVCKTPVKVHSETKKKTPPKSPPHALTLWLKPTGNAPIVKNKKWTVEKKQTIAMIMVFLKKYMNLEPSASMFLYVNQSFAPSPDIEVGNIYDCFNINGKLVLHYSTSPAWG